MMRRGMLVIAVCVIATAVAGAECADQTCADTDESPVNIDISVTADNINTVTTQFTVTGLSAHPTFQAVHRDPDPDVSKPISIDTGAASIDATAYFNTPAQFRFRLAGSRTDGTGSYTVEILHNTITTPLDAGHRQWRLVMTMPAGAHTTTCTSVSTVTTGGAAASAATATISPCNTAPGFDGTDEHLTAAPAFHLGTETEIDAPATINDVTFSLTDANDDDGDNLTCTWTLTTDGTAGDAVSADVASDGSATRSETIAATVTEISMQAQVTDEHGAAAGALAISNTRPNGHTIGEPVVSGDKRLQFSAVAPETPTPADPDAGDTIVHYHWSFGDGTERVSTTSTIEHTYANTATRTVTLRVQDSRGLWSEAALRTDVQPVEPPDTPSGIRVNDATDDPHWQEVPYRAELTATGPGLAWNVDDLPEGWTLHDSHVDVKTPALAQVTVTATESGLTGPASAITIGGYPGDAVSFPRARGLPYDPTRVPYPNDGVLGGPDALSEQAGTTDPYGESGWRGAYSIPYASGTDDIRIDLIRDGDNVYIGVNISYDNSIDAEDLIYIGIARDTNERFTATDNGAAILKLEPSVAGTTPGAGVTAFARQADGSWLEAPTPAGIVLGVDDRTDSGGHEWSAELRLPVSAGPEWLNLDSSFLLFVKVRQYEPSPVATEVWYTWPRTVGELTPIAAAGNPEVSTAWWGLAHRDDALPSNGIAFASPYAIGLMDPDNPEGTLGNLFVETGPYGGANRLTARISNDAHRWDLNASGERVPMVLDASQVSVRFRLAYWGITPPDAGPEYWRTIPIGEEIEEGVSYAGNPTPPVALEPIAPPVESGGTWVIQPSRTTVTADWVIADMSEWASDASDTDGFNESHQCILAEIIVHDDWSASPQDAVNVVTRSVYRNMNFDAQNDDIFIQPAQVVAPDSAGRYADGDGRILLRIYTRAFDVTPRHADRLADYYERIDTQKPGPVPEPMPQPGPRDRIPYMMELRPFIDPPRAMGRTHAVDSESHTAPLAEERAVETRSFIGYVVKAYAFTGRTITNGDEETEEVVPIGSYGHVVRHAGETEEWRFQIIGAEPLDDRTYLLTLRPGERARIEDHIDAVEPPRFTLVAQGGVAVPPSTLGGAFAIGPVATVDGGFHISKSESFRLQAGYGYLPSTTGGAPWHAARLTAFFQKSFPLFSWALPYVTVGGGMFINGDGGLSGGAIVAGGIDVAPTRSVHLRVGADFVGNKNHALFGVFGGLVYRFVER